MMTDPIEQQLRKEFAATLESFRKGYDDASANDSFGQFQFNENNHISKLFALYDTYTARRADEARHDELNKIVKAEDYVYTASNEDNKYEFDIEIYCQNRHAELNHKDSL